MIKSHPQRPVWPSAVCGPTAAQEPGCTCRQRRRLTSRHMTSSAATQPRSTTALSAVLTAVQVATAPPSAHLSLDTLCSGGVPSTRRSLATLRATVGKLWLQLAVAACCVRLARHMEENVPRTLDSTPRRALSTLNPLLWCWSEVWVAGVNRTTMRREVVTG